MSAKKVYFDPLRSLAFGSISGTYAAIGTATTVNPRIVCITNTTDADMIVTDDTTVSAGKLILPAGSFKLFDLTTNHVNKDDNFVIGKGVTLSVKEVTAPSKGAVYVEYLHAQP